MTRQGKDGKGEREGTGPRGRACGLTLFRAAERFAASCDFPEIVSQKQSSICQHVTGDDAAVRCLELIMSVKSAYIRVPILQSIDGSARHTGLLPWTLGPRPWKQADQHSCAGRSLFAVVAERHRTK